MTFSLLLSLASSVIISVERLWSRSESRSRLSIYTNFKWKNKLKNTFFKIQTWWILDERNGRVPFRLFFDRVEWRWGWCDDNADVVIVLINVETVWALCKSVTGPLRREEYMSLFDVYISLFFFLLHPRTPAQTVKFSSQNFP